MVINDFNLFDLSSLNNGTIELRIMLRAVKAWVLNRNTFSSIDAVLCDTCNFLIHSINALIKLDTILLFMLNDVTLRCAIN